jgi:hypothetical protein
LAAAFSLSTITACDKTPGIAQVRAANDFHCDPDQVEVNSIGGHSYRATGCDQSEVLDCVGTARVTCVPEGSGRTRPSSEETEEER